MRVCVTERREPLPGDLRPVGELAPDLALPWVSKLRYGVPGGLAITLLLVHFALGIELRFGFIAIPLAVMLVSNFFRVRVVAALGVRPALGALLALDIICLTALLALTGGPANPFTLLYLVQITLSAVVLSKSWTWALGVLSATGFAFLFVAHVPLSIFHEHQAASGFSAHLTGMWMAFGAGALLVTVFIGKVSEALRKGEQEVLQLHELIGRHERLASIATLAAGAAHELGTPLAVIAVVSKDLELDASTANNPEAAADARVIRAEVERCREIIQRMSADGAEPLGESPARVDVGALLEEVRISFPEDVRARIETRPPKDPLTAKLPHLAIRQALAALVKNGIDATAEGQSVLIEAEHSGAGLRFCVSDSGSGMSREELQRISEPFFSTKAPGHGMGLGTFLACQLTKRLNGSLIFESEPGAGARAIMEVPIEIEHEQRESAGVSG